MFLPSAGCVNEDSQDQKDGDFLIAIIIAEQAALKGLIAVELPHRGGNPSLPHHPHVG